MRQIHFLLGDPLRDRSFTIDEWVAQAQPRTGLETDTFIGNSETHFEYACALLYDARLHRAMEMFQFVSALARAENRPDMSVVARIGCGRAMNYLRRYRPANAFFSAAKGKSYQLKNGLIEKTARYFSTLNESDGGEKLTDLECLTEERDPLELTATEFLLDAFRVYVYSRVHLRSSQRKEGLSALEKLTEMQQFSLLPPMMQGLILRMRGIFLDVSGDTELARSNLKQAIEIFHLIRFRLGEVQAALSLARTYGPSDRKQAKEYLDRARHILENTEPPTASSPEGRHMPGERADLYSRLGNFEFSQGRMEEAAQFYRKDLQVLGELTVDPSEVLPRAAAYAHRNLGRVLSAQHEYEDAAHHFLESVKIFRTADDPINTFSSLFSLCDLWLTTKSFPAAIDGIIQLEGILSGLSERPKERALVEFLRARLARYHHDDDTEALSRITRAAAELRRFGTDYHYVQALLFHAEILQSIGDDLGARQRLVEARLCASNLEMVDLQRTIDFRLTQLGIPEPQIQNLRKSDLERQCELDGFVKKELTILFADIRGFTSISQRIETGVMVEFIYEFAGLISKYTSLFGGLPVRFLGDCVMALFGARGSTKERELTALQSICRTYEMFDNLRTRWSRKSDAFREVGVGFGVATGHVVAGRFGSAELSEFSVIGEAVNLASRLQGVAEDGDVVVCPATAKALSDSINDISFEDRQAYLKGFGEMTVRVISVEEALRFTGSRRRQYNNSVATSDMI